MTKRERGTIQELRDVQRRPDYRWECETMTEEAWFKDFADRERASELADEHLADARKMMTPLPELGVWVFITAGCVAWGLVIWWAR